MVDLGEVVQAMQDLCTAFGELSQAVNRGADSDTEAAEPDRDVPAPPTYDSRETGPRYHVTSRIGDRTIAFQQPLDDPFVRHTVHLGQCDLLRGLTVTVLVDGDAAIVNDVLELDANILVPNGDAINRLAQYLDRYRTDDMCPGLEPEAECAGTRNHGGECSRNADNIGVGAVTAKPSTVNSRGNCVRCGHSPHASRCREIREPECMGDECGCLALTALEDGGVAPRSGRYCTLCDHAPHGGVGCGEGGRGLHRCTCRGVA